MPNSFEQVDVVRHIVRINQKEYYVTIGERSIMVHPPNPSSFTDAPEYAWLNSICRLASKWMGDGATWGRVAYQLECSGNGHRTFLDDMVTIIRNHIHRENYLDE